jgi:hypothetical protein
MRKVIDVYMQGDIGRLLQVWVLPDSVVFTRGSPDVATVLLVDEGTEHFEGLEAVVRELGGAVRMEVSFWAHSYEPAECEGAELLHLSAAPVHGLDVDRRWQDLSDLQAHGVLTLYVPAPPERLIMTSESELLVCHRSIVAGLARRGLVTGLSAKPVRIETPQTRPDDDWLWIFSTAEVGALWTERRFVKALPRPRWPRTHFCVSSDGRRPAILIAQPVYRTLRDLPEAVRASLVFEPVDLLG